MNRVKYAKQLKNSLFFLIPLIIIPEYVRDCFLFLRHSGILGDKWKRIKLVGVIIAEYHVIEKGLTMPEPRLGFGKDNILSLLNHCMYYVNHYEMDAQVLHAIAVLYEYRVFHLMHNFQLASEIIDKLNQLESYAKDIKSSTQNLYTKDEFFKDVQSEFLKFSNSRKSIRNYSQEEIPIEVITKAIDYSRNTPSACNRQSVRVYLFTDKAQIREILQIQGANRGFGHLADKLIIVTSELALYHGLHERNAGFIDGGMFAMNLLYMLHYQKIAACSLNCSFSIQKEIMLRKLCKIKKSEVFVLMIACGYAPESFKSAFSERYSLDNILTIK
jgi:nitroreductase